MNAGLLLLLKSSGVLSYPDLNLDEAVQGRNTTLTDCLRTANVPISLNTSSDWSSLTTPYNLRLSWTPAVVTIPETQQHVEDSIKCAAASSVTVQAKSGGHSYSSYSTGGQDGSLIVNLQNFQDISVDDGSIYTELSRTIINSD